MKEKFNSFIENVQEKNNSFIMSQEKYESLIKDDEKSKSTNQKTAKDYRRLKHYDVLSIDGVK